MDKLLLDGDYSWHKESSYLWILDAGHGGIDSKGKYTTAPAKMHLFPDGQIVYEGVINRLVCNLLKGMLKSARIDYAVVSDPVQDNSLTERARLADVIYGKDKRAVYLSIHSNAGGGSGFEVFTSPGQTKSDALAEFFCEHYKENFPQFKLRADHTDGDADKEADFYVLRKTDCPAVLVENLFFDNRKEADFLMSSVGQEKIAHSLFSAIQEIEKFKPIK